MARYRLRTIERRALTPAQLWGSDQDFWPSKTLAGVAVSAQTALNAPAVWACVRLISNDIAGMPLHAYRKTDDFREEIKLPEWLERPLPDPNVTRAVHVGQVVTSLLLEGNAFVRFYPSVRNPVAVEVLDPSAVEIVTQRGGIDVTYRLRDGRGELTAAELVHIPLIVLPGERRGLNPIDAASETIGLTIAATQFGAAFFGNGATMSGFLKYPEGQVPAEETVKELKRSFTKQHVGVRKSHAFGILTGGASWQDVQGTNKDAQLLELREYQVEDVARMYGVPPHLVGSQKPGAVSYSSVEQRAIDYVSKAVQPIVEKIEDAYKRTLRGERTYLKFNMDGLLRADISTRYTTYSVGLQNRFLTGDEVRLKEDLEPMGLGFLDTPNNNAGGTDPNAPEGEEPPPDGGPPQGNAPQAGWDPAQAALRHRPGGKDHDQADHAPKTRPQGTGGESPAGAPTGAGTKEDPVVTSDVEEAARLLGEGKHVRLTSTEVVATLVDRLAAIAKDAEARGEQAPNYDLCRVTVAGTNVFCVESKGIPRIEMPQLKAKNVNPGSEAEELERDKDGEVDLYQPFLAHLEDMGVGASEDMVDARFLKASQSELNGVKVSRMMGAIKSGAFDPRTGNPMIVSRDNYVVDGHHRWAAVVGMEYAGVDLDIPALKVDMDILDLLDEANAYASEMGIPGQGFRSLHQPCDKRGGCAVPAWHVEDAVVRHHPGGKDHDQKDHGKWADGVQPIYASDKVPAASKGGRQAIQTDDPTRVANLPEQHVANLRERIARWDPDGKGPRGLEPLFPDATDETLDTNLAALLERGLENPAAARGAGWYDEAHDIAAKMAADNGFSLEQTVGALAGMSPQQVWGSNVATAGFVAEAIAANPKVALTPEWEAFVREELRDEGVTDIVLDGSRTLDQYTVQEQASIIKAMGREQGLKYVDDVTGKEYAASWSCGLNGVVAAIQVLRGEDPDEVLGGHKVRSFYNNIFFKGDPNGAVTIDTHAVSAAFNEMISASDPRMGWMMAGPSLTSHSTKGIYPILADAYRRVARQYNLNPEQAQAIIWLQWRYETEGKRGKGKKAAA